MGEYDRQQRNQLSKAINHSESKNSQSKGFVDNRPQSVGQRKLIHSFQNRYLLHEAGYAMQPKQGKAQPTMQMQGVNVNDNEGLEKVDIQMKEKAHAFSEKVTCCLTVYPVIQGKWIWDESYKKYHTEELYDGVRWYATSMSNIYFIIENSKNIKLGRIDDYNKMEGEHNARSWDAWNSISVTPFRNLDKMPESDSLKIFTFEKIIESIKNGFQNSSTLKQAFECLGVSARGQNNMFIKMTINKELAKGTPNVISKLLEYEEIELKKEYIEYVKRQFQGMDISDKGQDTETVKVISGYTLSEFEYVTAFIRGTVWMKDLKKYRHATLKERLRGAQFLTRMNNVWGNAPTADVEYTWRTESKDPGEISKGGSTTEYTKSNPASTSVNIIPHRAGKKENILLKIKNSNRNDKACRPPIDMRKYSQYPEEGEILYPAYTKYRVENEGKEGIYKYTGVTATTPEEVYAKTAVEKDISDKLENPPIADGIAEKVDRNAYATLGTEYYKWLTG